MQKKPNDPKDHHFVPKFILKRWCAPGRTTFWRYRRDPNGDISASSCGVKGVGSVDYLYTLEIDGLSITDSSSPKLETEFFSPLDNDASLIFEKLIAEGVDDLTPEERLTWSRFVRSLLERSPTRLSEIRAELPEDFLQCIFNEFEKRFMAGSDRLRIKRILDKTNRSAFVRNSILQAVIRHINEPDFLEYIAQMHWVILELPEGSEHFLTGDTPVIVNEGDKEKQPIYSLSMALSPKILLVMHKPIPEFDRERLVGMAWSFNIWLVAQTERDLVSSQDLSSGTFIPYQDIVESLLDVNASNRHMEEQLLRLTLTDSPADVSDIEAGSTDSTKS